MTKIPVHFEFISDEETSTGEKQSVLEANLSSNNVIETKEENESSIELGTLPVTSLAISEIQSTNEKDSSTESVEIEKSSTPKTDNLSLEETVELLTNLATLQEDLARAESQTKLARKHVEIVQSELAKINEEKSEWKDQLLRQRAEFENFRKRIEREKQEIYGRTRSEVITPILEVLDNLERALNSTQSETPSLESFLEGVELIQKQLYTTLLNFGLSPMTVVGENFDPTLHEAVVTEETEGYEHNTIIQELKRGYLLGDKLLRPAMVKVCIRS